MSFYTKDGMYVEGETGTEIVFPPDKLKDVTPEQIKAAANILLLIGECINAAYRVDAEMNKQKDKKQISTIDDDCDYSHSIGGIHDW